MSKKHKKICTTLSYIEHLLIITSVATRFVSISAFASLVGIPIESTSSAVGLKICGFNWLIYLSWLIFLVNNLLRGYNDMKEEIKNLNTSSAHQRF